MVKKSFEYQFPPIIKPPLVVERTINKILKMETDFKKKKNAGRLHPMLQ